MIRQQGPRLRTMSSSNPQHEVPHGEFSRPGPGTDLTPQLRTLLDGKTLEAEAASDAFEAMMSGEVHHGEMGALLALLASRGPSRDELLGAARVMRRHVSPITSRTPAENILDTAGTGGAPKTFNVSTAAAIVAAGAGAVVAKHGNRSRTGRGALRSARARAPWCPRRRPCPAGCRRGAASPPRASCAGAGPTSGAGSPT